MEYVKMTRTHLKDKLHVLLGKPMTNKIVKSLVATPVGYLCVNVSNHILL